MKFVLTIDTQDNDAVQSRQDVAWLLDGVARKLRSNTQVMNATIVDTGDRKVGEWEIHDEEFTPVFGVPVYVPPTSAPSEE